MVIKWTEITRIELGTINVFKINEFYPEQAYIISSEKKVIKIQITKRNKAFLSQLFQKHEKFTYDMQQE